MKALSSDASHLTGQPSATTSQSLAHLELKETFNRYFDVGCTTFTKHELLAYGRGNRRRIEACLVAWESRGCLQILKPFETAEDDDVVVKLLDPIN